MSLSQLDKDLLKAAHEGTVKELRECLDRGANPDARDPFGNATPNHKAAQKGYRECLRILLEANANPNISSKGGLTPLHLASKEGHRQCVELLIKFKADLNAQNDYGRTPLNYACGEGRRDCARLLIQAGANLNLVDRDGQTPLHLACIKGRLNCIKLLIEAGAKLDKEDFKEKKPLDVAGSGANVSKDTQNKIIQMLNDAIRENQARQEVQAASQTSIGDKNSPSFNIFVSYCHKNKENVMPVYERLNRDVGRVWIDVNQIRGDLNDDMAKGVQQSALIVLFFSSGYFESKHCKKEINYADSLEKPIIPVRIDPNYRPSDWLGLIIAGKTYYDLSSPDCLEKNYSRFIEAIRITL